MLTAAALCALAHLDPAHYAFALAEPADLSAVPVAELTPEQLLAEQQRLEPYRTAFVGPVVMTAVGGGVLVFGAAFFVVGFIYAVLPLLVGGSVGGVFSGLQIVGFALMAVSGVAVIAGSIVLTIGLVKLFPALARRREAMERRDEIQQRLDALDPAKAPPPPPPLPPGVNALWRGPESTLLLATF